jgi:hypothetical protein
MDDPWPLAAVLAGAVAALSLVLNLFGRLRPFAGVAAPLTVVAVGSFRYGLPNWPTSDPVERLLLLIAAATVVGLAVDLFLRGQTFVRRGLLVALPVLASLWLAAPAIGGLSQTRGLVLAVGLVAIAATLAMALTEQEAGPIDGAAMTTAGAIGLALLATSAALTPLSSLAWLLAGASGGAAFAAMLLPHPPGNGLIAGLSTGILGMAVVATAQAPHVLGALAPLLCVLLIDRLVILPAGQNLIGRLGRTLALTAAGSTLILAALGLSVAAGGRMPPILP